MNGSSRHLGWRSHAVFASVVLLVALAAIVLSGCGGQTSAAGASALMASPNAGASPGAPAGAATTAPGGTAASSGASPSTQPAGTATPAGPTEGSLPLSSAFKTPSPTATATATATAKPTAKPTTSAAPTPADTDTDQPTPSPSPSATPSFVVCGKVDNVTTFTVAQLKKMATVSATYFSRGGHPTTEESTPFVGVRLIDILNAAGLASDATRVTILAADHYSATFTLQQVKADYIDETRPGVVLPMIIAYSEDGTPYTGAHPFRLVMGEQMAGDYNRMYWVYIVTTITVQ